VALVRKLASLAVLPLALCSAERQAAAAQELEPLTVQPFTAVYQLEWHGIIAGFSTLTLSEAAPGMYSYSSVNRARGIFRLAFPDAISEQSTFRMAGGRVEPLSYREHNGSRANQNVSLDFDWNAGRARGTAAGKSVDQPLEPGTQDPLSVQVELMRDLIAGDPPTHFLLFDRDSAKQYQYTREGTATLETAMGRFETIIYRSDRPDSDRVMRLWLAPSLGFLPVQAVRWRKGKVEFELHIRAAKRSPAAETPQSARDLPAPPD
jgi:hypothetical protein